MKVVAFLVLCAVVHEGWALCNFEGTLGTWTFFETKRTFGNYPDCLEAIKDAYRKTVTLSYPNMAFDEIGNRGTWSMVSFSGFEVHVAGRSYYAHFGRDCKSLNSNWSRDFTIRNWSCFYGTKDEAAPMIKEKPVIPKIPFKKFVNDHVAIKIINTAQSSWTAKAYDFHEQYTLREMFNRAGGDSGVYELPPLAPATREDKAKISQYPTNFDWRSVNGENYLSPVRNQGSCASCYAFSSTAQIEARLQISTMNNRKEVFSPQDVVDCCPMTAGCNGGWNYLAAGRYAKDNGFIADRCNPYLDQESGRCQRNPSCLRQYVSDYEYVGGYYGAGNEERIMQDLVSNGPVSVLYQVYDDFFNYDGGVYHHISSVQPKNGFDPYVQTNHAVLLVGYGVDPITNEKFWTIKNSWGAKWGEAGYFKIRRGTNECGIESAAFSSHIIV